MYVEKNVPFTSRTPTYLTPEQRHALTQIPADLSDREIARYYTFTQQDLDLIKQRRRLHNRLGFAVQLAVLRFPGRPLKDLAGIPSRILAAIADQIQVPASAFARYGDRDNTLYEHLDEIRQKCKFRECGWREYLWLARELLPLALESDRPIPLIEQALELLRKEHIIAPGLTHLERLIWVVLKAAEKRLFRLLTADLTLEHRTRLDGLLYADSGRRGTAKLTWLREPPGLTSAKSVKQIVERLLFLRGLELPAMPAMLYQNRVLQLARKCSKYQTQPLLKFKAERRHALLRAHLFELSQDLTDQALDQFDKLLGELLRKGERRQEKHFHTNARKLNSHLTILARAAEAFLLARTEGNDPVAAVLTAVSEPQLAATVNSAKQLLRPENLDSLDLIESRYTPMRQSLLSLYQALDFQPVRKSEPALAALEYVADLAKRHKRVIAREQKVGKVKTIAPLGHLTERWRKHALQGDEIAPNYYEAAAFEALKGRVRSGDVAVGGSRRYRAFEGYLLPTPHFEQLTQKSQTRLAVSNEAEAYLADKQQEIAERLAALQESVGKVEGSLCLDEKGHLYLPPLDKEIPAEVERLRPRVYGMLPQIKLPDLLLEVDNWTGFLRSFTHLTSGDAPVGDEKLILVATLMGMGMNFGLSKMEQSCPYSYRQLSWSGDWHIREETLLASLACLDNFVLSAPLSRSWGDGTTSSSDGMRMHVGVKAANAEYNAKYFGPGRGTNIYTHAADIWMPFGKPQVIGTNEEALYAIDALCHHESDLHIGLIPTLTLFGAR